MKSIAQPDKKQLKDALKDDSNKDSVFSRVKKESNEENVFNRVRHEGQTNDNRKMLFMKGSEIR